jgi:hypothetical protein
MVCTSICTFFRLQHKHKNKAKRSVGLENGIAERASVQASKGSQKQKKQIKDPHSWHRLCTYCCRASLASASKLQSSPCCITCFPLSVETQSTTNMCWSAAKIESRLLVLLCSMTTQVQSSRGITKQQQRALPSWHIGKGYSWCFT